MPEDDQRPSYIVGIGASAGGLEALQTFFNNMPPDTGLAFVVIQHLSPDYKSLMVELLSKHTKMDVVRVEDGMQVRPNVIYLIPPKKNMTIHGGRLYLSEQTERHGLNLPIDVFFKSLGEDQGERAIGIILSGTGSDGTRGIRAIKGEGGLIMVQNEATAKFDGMPKSAITTGLADYILPPEKMPEELLKFINHPYISEKKEPHDITGEQDIYSRILSLIRKATNVDFTYYKPATVSRRIERRMGIIQVLNPEDYISYLLRNPKEVHALFKDLLIGVTKFFRDPESFEIVRQIVIPDIFKNALEKGNKSIRVWVAGCSTGEEAYSIAMLIREYMDTNHQDMEVKVFATDIDKDAIEFAGIGLYPDSIAADVDVRLLSRYAEKQATGYQIKRNIREMVVFALQNLIKDPPFTKIDLILCRNLLIYFQPFLQKKVLSIFNYALVPNGYLFLGSSETLGDLTDMFEPMNSKHRIYKHRGQGVLPIKDPIALPHSEEYTLSAARVAYEYRKPSAPYNRAELKEKYYHALINKIVNTLLVIDEKRELIQAFGNTKRFLNIPQGNVTLDIMALLPRELSLAVSSAIHRIQKEKQPIEFQNIRLRDSEQPRLVNMRVEIITEIKDAGPLFLIELEDSKTIDTDIKTVPITNILADERISHLEQEIQFTRENLQATIEELQTSNEELQATNEELLAANEELQSTNEELQSVNEELNTVNSEYQSKVIELTELNNDMNNLMSSIDIGTIFLDKDLRIRKFTPATTRNINLIEQDIGRPLSDLSMPMFDNLIKDAEEVIKTGTEIERTIETQTDCFQVKTLPFIDDMKKINGVVITIVNITTQKNAEKMIQRQYELLRRILETSPAAQLMTDKTGKIRFANNHAEEILKIDQRSLVTLKFDSQDLPLTDLAGNPFKPDESPMELILKSGQMLKKHIICVNYPDKSKVVLSVTGNPSFNEKGEIDGAVFKLEKVAHQTT